MSVFSSLLSLRPVKPLVPSIPTLILPPSAFSSPLAPQLAAFPSFPPSSVMHLLPSQTQASPPPLLPLLTLIPYPQTLPPPDQVPSSFPQLLFLTWSLHYPYQKPQVLIPSPSIAHTWLENTWNADTGRLLSVIGKNIVTFPDNR